MELTQTWQNPPFRFATIKKSRSAACKCFRPETHSETEGTIYGRKQRPHPSVPDPVRAAGSFFRRRLGCLHWTDAVSLKIFEIHRSGRFSAQNRPDIFRKNRLNSFLSEDSRRFFLCIPVKFIVNIKAVKGGKVILWGLRSSDKLSSSVLFQQDFCGF